MNRKINVDLLSIIFLIISLTLLIYVCYKDLFIQKSLSFNTYYYVNSTLYYKKNRDFYLGFQTD